MTEHDLIKAHLKMELAAACSWLRELVDRAGKPDSMMLVQSSARGLHNCTLRILELVAEIKGMSGGSDD